MVLIILPNLQNCRTRTLSQRREGGREAEDLGKGKEDLYASGFSKEGKKTSSKKKGKDINYS